MRLKHRILAGLSILIATASIAAAAIPGPQRMLVPSWYGLSEIAPNVFSDDPTKAGLQLDFLENADRKVTAFFGKLKSQPRYIFCTTMTCEQTFGKSGQIAVAYGWQFIHIPPHAFLEPKVGQILVTHERVHVELVSRWGWTAIYDERIPSWFNEGLASFISDDDRIRYDHSKSERDWIKQSTSFWEWGDFASGDNWRMAYGAAASEVKLLQEKLGSDGLLKLITTAIDGDGLENALQLDTGL